METIFGDASFWTIVLLFLALALAFGFEFVNGFHDTANAVATVIYTNSLKPTYAVIWSGFWNFLGVLTSSGAVAFGIVALLPVELIVNVGSGAGFAMVFALLLSAIIWNLGTWYMGLPASSSHTLIGSIMGVGLMNSYMSPERAFGEGVNWGKAQEVGTALLVSPLVGFACSALLLLAARAFIKMPSLFTEPPKGKTPPLLVRGLLMLTCTGVSFAHGSNDGQKGMGLIMLILIGILPASYALNLGTSNADVAAIAALSSTSSLSFQKLAGAQKPGANTQDDLTSYLNSKVSKDVAFAALAEKTDSVAKRLSNLKSFDDLNKDDRRSVRKDIYLVSESIKKLDKAGALPADEKKPMKELQDKIKPVTNFIPDWVKFAVALALGLGTMVGWKRIVVTVGEKIGKAHLTYAQGASAELVAAITIEAADIFGLPVSTTHVLSSGVAGTMAAAGSGLQMQTLRNVLLAWVLTLPACVFLGATLFAAGLFFVFKVLGMQ